MNIIILVGRFQTSPLFELVMTGHALQDLEEEKTNLIDFGAGYTDLRIIHLAGNDQSFIDAALRQLND